MNHPSMAENVGENGNGRKKMCRPFFRTSVNSSLLFCFVIFFNLASFSRTEDDRQKNSAEQKQQKGNRPDVAICEGSLSAFFVSDNMNIRGVNASSIVRGINEKQCVDFCAKNNDHKGRTVLCASAVYENESQECRLFRRASMPDGEMTRKPEEGRRYFEKFCLPEEAPSNCGHRQFVRVDDYILKGYAQSTTTVPTMAECAAYCMREREFECKSAMYFWEEGECITNVESAITAPDDFQRPDDDDKVIFFHNGCILPGAGTRGSPGEFELAQSQDPGTANAPTAPEEQTAATINENENHSTSSATPPSSNDISSSFSSSSSSSFPPSSPPADGMTLNSVPEQLTEQKQSSTIVAADEPNAFVSSSIPPDVADAIPTSSTTEAAGTGGDETSSNPNVPSDSSNNGESANGKEKEESSAEEGQTLKESANDNVEATQQQFSPKAIPIPPSVTEESSTAPQFHPKQLAPAGNPQEESRQYGAKTIERASDGSFQEKMPTTDGKTSQQNSSVASTAARALTSRKGPESSKRLQLKLIKDQQQPKPDISSITLGPPPQLSSIATQVPIGSQPSSTEHSQQQNQPASSVKLGEPARVPEEQQQQLQPQKLLVVPEQSAEERFEGNEGYFSHWGPWTPCHVPGERRVRRRKCLDLRRCKGALMQVDYCPRDIPPPPAIDDATREGADEQQSAAAAESQKAAQQQQAISMPIPVPLQQDGPAAPPAAESESTNPQPIGLAENVSSVSDAAGNLGNGQKDQLQEMDGVAQPPAIMPLSLESDAQQQKQQQQPIPAGAPAPRPSSDEEATLSSSSPSALPIWSPWNGTCQHFASSQPCKEDQVIGFESRECIAQDPLACKGPFFRYCTLPC